MTDGGDISGSLTDVLTVSTVVPGDAGVYQCYVTGDCGIDNSDPATLTVNEYTLITGHPAAMQEFITSW